MRATSIVVALFIAAAAGGCIQTLPDGSVVATPTSGGPLATRGPLDGESGPAPQHVAAIDRYGRVAAADPDVHIRSSLRRDPCQTILPDGGCAGGGSD